MGMGLRVGKRIRIRTGKGKKMKEIGGQGYGDMYSHLCISASAFREISLQKDIIVDNRVHEHCSLLSPVLFCPILLSWPL